MATVSVLDFKADPSGKADSTQAFLDAQQAAKGGTVRIPRGDYRIQPDRDRFNWWDIHWIGESNNNNPERSSRILPTDEGEVLVKLPGRGTIEGVVIDCDHKVETGLYAPKAHEALLNDVIIRHAKGYGARFFQSTMDTYRLSTENCGKGMLLEGCNAAHFISPKASHCQGVGIHVIGGAAGTGTSFSGGLTMSSGWVERCGLDGKSPLVHFSGVEGGNYQLFYLEGQADGIWLSDGVHNCNFVGSRIVIDPAHVALRLQGAKMNTFTGFSSSNSQFSYSSWI